MQGFIICCGTHGRCVVFGYAEHTPVVGGNITLSDARMVLYWPSECGGLFGLAASGPKDGLRLTYSVSETATVEVRQYIVVSDDIAAQLTAWPAFEG